MVRRKDVQQLSLFDGQGEERTLPVPEQTNEDVQRESLQPKRPHIHVEVHYADGSHAILCTAMKDPDVQRHIHSVQFVGAMSALEHCPICNADQSKTLDLTLDDLMVFSLANLKGVHDHARRVWLRIWAESHDCPEEHLMYSESGYYQVPFWPVGKQQLLYRIRHGNGLLIYSLFVHCLGLRLEVCLREAIARGEIKDPCEEDL